MGARSGGGGGMRSGGGIVGMAKAAQKAFYSKGNSEYFNGSNSPSAVKAYKDYQKKLNAFKSAWTKAGGGSPAFDSWSSLMNDVADGYVSIV